MASATVPHTDDAKDFDPATLNVISPDKYQREGYPHADWTWLRNNDPVRYFEGQTSEPFWAVTKHADIVAIGKNPRDWIIEPRVAVFDEIARPEEPQVRHLLNMDPPDHGKYRNLISKAFTPRTVQVWESRVQDITRKTLDRAAEKGDIDFVADVSAPITIEVIALMLGVPEPDWPLLFRWTNEIIASDDPEFQKGESANATFNRARLELFAYFKELADERRVSPTDDIVSKIVHSSIGGQPLGDIDLLSYFFLLVVAGNETTRNAMTGGVQCFIDNPDQWAALAAEPDLVEGAIEETVRWTTSVNQFARTATQDMTLRDKTIRKGESVCLFYASGNRDEEVFDDPFKFRIDRWPNDHIGFGRGEHVCLGAHLARLEIRSVYQQLRERLVSMERTAPVDRVRSSFIGGIKRAPMRWTLR